ncbi:hypothetical protein [Leptospira kirschneri]|nr:hypothetical protein [Leptospira kirschneri]UZW37089.1 hypothetical protein ORQ95_05425 [Leptospira kirschneri]WHP00785.1 hypothetical protein QMK36_05440 [Leptospira kirschneri]
MAATTKKQNIQTTKFFSPKAAAQSSGQPTWIYTGRSKPFAQK